MKMSKEGVFTPNVCSAVRENTAQFCCSRSEEGNERGEQEEEDRLKQEEEDRLKQEEEDRKELEREEPKEDKIAYAGACKDWANKMGYCSSDSEHNEFMIKNCAKTCRDLTEEGDSNSCNVIHEKCEIGSCCEGFTCRARSSGVDPVCSKEPRGNRVPGLGTGVGGAAGRGSRGE